MILEKIRNGAPIVVVGLIVIGMEKIRKYWPSLIAGICVGLVLVFAQGCARAKCPSGDVYMGVMTPFGPLPFMLPKGYLDDPGNYLTEEQMKEMQRQQEGQPAGETPEKQEGI